MKFLTTLLFTFFTISSFAQVLGVQYFKNEGRQVGSVDSSDYIRIISLPGSGSELFNISEYYCNKTRRLIGKSSYGSTAVFERQTISFFENGRRKSIINYEKGYPADTAYYFYPKGKHYMVTYCFSEKPKDKQWKNDYNVVSQYGTTGNSSIVNGNGRYAGYDEQFRKMTEECEVQNSKRVQEWKGIELNGKLSFTEQYTNGKLMQA